MRTIFKLHNKYVFITMKRTILILLVTLLASTHATSAQAEKESFQGYLKIHLGPSIQEQHYSLNGGGSYGFYLGQSKRFGTGFGFSLNTYSHQNTDELIEGGGIALFLETVLLPLSHKYSLTAFGGIGFLTLANYQEGSIIQEPVDEFSERYPLLGFGLDYYPRERLSLGLRTSYAFLNENYVPSTHMSLSLGTRF